MESIQDYWQKIKVYLEGGLREWGIAVLVALIAATSFGLGRLSVLSAHSSISIAQPAHAAQAIAQGGMYVGSVSSKNYYFPWCGQVEKIPKEEQVWFSNESEAESVGYSKGQGCKGLNP